MRFVRFFLILALLVCPIVASAQFKAALGDTNTDNTATIIIPSSANPLMSDGSSLLVTGDSIGVFNSSGVCYGSAKWVAGSSLVINVFGKSQTPAPDEGGFADNEVMYIKIKHGGVVYSNLKIIYLEYMVEDGETYAFITDGKYHYSSFPPTYVISSIGIQKLVSVNAYLHGMWNAGTGKHFPAAVSLELRQNITGTTLMTSALVLRKAGIIDSNGIITVDFGTVIDGNYWVVLRTAGFLPLGTTSKVTLSGSATATYNFTDALTKAAGGISAMIQPVTPGPCYSRAGDFNGDCANTSPDYGSFFKKSIGKTVATSYPVLTRVLPVEKITAPAKNVTLTLKLHGLAGTTIHKQAAVSVELRTGTTLRPSSGDNLVSCRTGLINTSGVVTVDFGGVADGSYWVVVRPAGYLPLGGTAKINLSAAATATYDFTDLSTKSLGGISDVFQPVNPGPWYLRPGDFNFDNTNTSPDYGSYFKKSIGKTVATLVPAP